MLVCVCVSEMAIDTKNGLDESYSNPEVFWKAYIESFTIQLLVKTWENWVVLPSHGNWSRRMENGN